MNQRMLVGAAALLTLASTGCGTAGRCDGEVGCGDAAPAEADCLEALAAHRAMDGCGVFATFSFDESGDGTMASPVTSLARAIELARAGRRRVFACNQWTYPEFLTIPSGIDIHGGFNCDRGWRYEADAFRTILFPARDPGHSTIVPDEGKRDELDDGVSTLTDVDFNQFGTIPGSGTALGILVESEAALELIRSKVVGWEGGAGRDGSDPSLPNRARDGTPGNPGSDACSADTVPGGATVTTACEDGFVSTGGKGGDGHADRGEAGSDGTPLPSANPDGDGLGGRGASAGSDACYPGNGGRQGDPGANGRSGRGPGRMTRTGWVGERGTDGTDGAHGTGGGGGGALGGAVACGASPKGGASGGSGGSGGCGGKGGRGGGYGGASIGILAFAGARVTLREVVIEPGDGGNGGWGAYGQNGGVGQTGGSGGQPQAGGVGACYGGSGGYGGNGGHGGGGTGGPSIGIVYVDEDQLTLENVTITPGAPGKGGLTYMPEDDKGDDGFAAEMYRFSL